MNHTHVILIEDVFILQSIRKWSFTVAKLNTEMWPILNG